MPKKGIFVVTMYEADGVAVLAIFDEGDGGLEIDGPVFGEELVVIHAEVIGDDFLFRLIQLQHGFALHIHAAIDRFGIGNFLRSGSVGGGGEFRFAIIGSDARTR